MSAETPFHAQLRLNNGTEHFALVHEVTTAYVKWQHDPRYGGNPYADAIVLYTPWAHIADLSHPLIGA